MYGFFIRLSITAVALWVASAIVPGIQVDDPTTTLVLAALLLGIVNAIVRPFLIVLTLPISVLTLGLFLLVINAGMLGLVAWLLDDFMISGFFSALLGSFIVSIVSWWASWAIGPEGRVDYMMIRKFPDSH